MFEESTTTTTSQTREVVSSTPHNARFLLRQRVYNLQYSHIYSNRITMLRPLLLASVSTRWGVGTLTQSCTKIIDLRPKSQTSTTKDWVVCGCIYKDMSLRPSILDTYSGACACGTLRGGGEGLSCTTTHLGINSHLPHSFLAPHHPP